MRGAIILAGGPSRRLGRTKALIRIGSSTLIERVSRAARTVVDEVVVVSRGTVAEAIQAEAPEVRVIRERARIQTPLVGLRAGARALHADRVAALGCDLPFLRPRLLDRLFREARNVDAAIPRWPDGTVEPLVAVYRRVSLLAATEAALAARGRSNQAMIGRLRRVRFVPVDALRRFDRDLRSFVNVNTPGDLARARRLMRSGARPRTR